MATIRGKGSSEFSIDRTVEDRVRLQRIADSNRPESKIPLGQLNQVDGKVYIYSGPITITSGSYTTVMTFVSGSDPLDINFQIASETTAGSDLYYKININDINIITQFMNNSFQTYPYGFSPVKLIIPPFSKVEITSQRGSGSDYNVFGTITGEVIK